MLIINIILWIWSHFPVLCLSDDSNFATLNWKHLKKGKADLRLSLVNVMFGDYVLYLVTFNIKQKKMELMHVLRLEDMEGILLTDEKIGDIQNRYRAHIESLLDENYLEIEKEKLCYHIMNEEKRIDTSINKLNIYATIILTVLPLVLTMLDFKKVFNLSYPLLMGIIFMTYSLINICVYIFRAIKVRGIKKSSFRDLRNSEKKDKEIILQYQYDWQQLKYKAQLFVSFVQNLQEWIIVTLFLILFVSIGVSYSDINKNNKVNNIGYNTVHTLNVEEIDKPYSDSSVAWQELLLDIEKKQCEKIILITNDTQGISFLDGLEKYSDLEIKVLRDAALEDGMLKIIREK